MGEDAELTLPLAGGSLHWAASTATAARSTRSVPFSQRLIVERSTVKCSGPARSAPATSSWVLPPFFVSVRRVDVL